MNNSLVRRPRRLRKNPVIRAMVRETALKRADFIYPLFVVEGEGIKEEIPSLPGVYHYSLDRLAGEVRELREAGVPAVILFGIPSHKDETGSAAYAADGIVQRAVRELRRLAPELYIITDVCLCQYTSHGHCGILREDGGVDNDQSLIYLAKTALSHAQAGADMVAPSDMMDGRIGAIRRVLDENGLTEVAIMAYSAKYASSFYGPFRDAAGSAPAFGDRKSYQMDVANSDEALREVALDVQEGADIVMVKPALAYLDVIRRVKDSFNLPLAAYNVSGEYAMLKGAVAAGTLSEEAVGETLLAIKRAGADLIISYFAKEICRKL
ncbi:MAG: porphobilinogen synthase [Peptococcaceae bacterium]|nr:porphobilinogen synthase [Peptococcaceae bacterium]